MGSVIGYQEAHGPVATFETDVAGMIKSLVVDINPVQSGTGDPSPDNIRPITGWTGAKVTKCGKNLFNESNAIVEYDSNRYCKLENGLLHYKNDGGSYCYSKQFDIYLPSGSYALSLSNYRLVSGISPIWIIKIGNAPLIYPTTNKDYIFTLAEPNTVTIRLSTSGTTSATEFYGNVQLELGSTATAYEPYQGGTYHITFPSAAGTVYGGKLDVVKGELVVDRGKIVKPSIGNVLSQTNPAVIVYGTTGAAAEVNSQVNPILISNACKTVAANTQYLYSVLAIALNATSQIRLSIPGLTTKAEYEAWIADNNFEIVYPLATPITYQLTSQEIQTIIGTNTIYVDTGDVSVLYPKTLTPAETVSNVNLIELRRNIIAAQGNDNLYNKWIWKQEKNDFVIRNNTVGFIEGLGNNIYTDQRSDRENNRRSIVVKRGMVPFVSYDSVSGGTYAPVKMYPIPIPPDAINVQMSCNQQNLKMGGMFLRLANGKYEQIKTNSASLELSRPLWTITGNNHFFAPYISRKDDADFTGTLENVRITFSRNGQWRWILTDNDLTFWGRSISWDSTNSRITYSSSAVNNYKTIIVPDGLCGYYTNGELQARAPVPVPPTATKVTVTTTPALQAQMILLRAADDQTQQLIADSGWKNTPASITFTADDNLELAVALRVNSSAPAFTTSATPTEIIIQFE